MRQLNKGNILPIMELDNLHMELSGSSLNEWDTAVTMYCNCANTWIALAADISYSASCILYDEITNSGLINTIVLMDTISYDYIRDTSVPSHLIVTQLYKEKVPAPIVLQLLRFPKRLTLPFSVTGIRDEALTNFRKFVLSLPTEFEESKIIFDLRAILETLNFDISPRPLRVSPGTTSDAYRNRYDKYRILASHDAVSVGLIFQPQEGKTPYTQRLTCVPKSATKGRIISAKPVVAQAQCYEIADIIYDAIRTSSVMGIRWSHFIHDSNSKSASIDVDAQMYNRCALTDPSIATIDLSSASDSISYSFAKAVLPANLFSLIDGEHSWSDCRAKYLEGVYDSGKGFRIPNNILFLSGEACCFPCEEIIFTSIALLACVYYATYSSKDPIPLLEKVSVFGDDVILPNEVAPTFVTLLETLHFTPSTVKSYWTGPYRESCGAESWEQVAFKTIYWPRKDVTDRPFVESLIALQHRLLHADYYLAASAVECAVLDELPNMTYSSIEQFRTQVKTDGLTQELSVDPFTDLIGPDTKVKARFSPHIDRIVHCFDQKCIEAVVAKYGRLTEKGVQDYYSTHEVPWGVPDLCERYYYVRPGEWVQNMGNYVVINVVKYHDESWLDVHARIGNVVQRELTAEEIRRAEMTAYTDFLQAGPLVIEELPGVSITESRIEASKRALYGSLDWRMN